MINPRAWLTRHRSSLFAPRPRRRRVSVGAAVAALERLEERVLLCGCTGNTAPTVILQYEQVEDKAGYGQAPDGYLTGEVTDDTYHDNSQYEVRIDLDFDGITDESATYVIDPALSTEETGKFRFVYELPDYLQESGHVAVQIAELARGECPLLHNGWSGFNYARTPPPNEKPEVKFTELENGYGVGSVSVSGEIIDYTPQGHYLIEIDGDADGTADSGLSITEATRGAFTIAGYQSNDPDVVPLVRITELDMYGRTYTTGWVPVEDLEDPNNRPVFDPAGVYEKTIGYGELGQFTNIATVTASDPDGDTLKYWLYEQASLLGFGSDGNFFNRVPRGLTIDENTGVITVDGADGLANIREFYERGNQYGFSVMASDGQAEALTGFTLVDDWQYWIGKAKAHIDIWAAAYGSALVASGSNAHDAIQEFDAFAGVDHIGGVAGAANGLLWAIAPFKPVASALGSAITDIAADAIAAQGDNGHSAIMAAIHNLVDQVTTDSLDERTRIQGLKHDEVLAVEGALDNPNNNDPPVEKARQAHDLYAFLFQELDKDVTAPSMNDILGGLLVDFAVAKGFDLQFLPGLENDYGYCGTWTSDDWELGTMDGTDVADKLNEIGYNPNGN